MDLVHLAERGSGHELKVEIHREVIMLRNKMNGAGASDRTIDGRPMSEDRRKELLAMTELGKQVMNGKN